MAEKPKFSESKGDATVAAADLADTVSEQAHLAYEERNAALRALAGRLAHQIRNPLAAVRAACGSLKSEIEDADQQETLDLALQEIDRMLSFVTATVQTIPDHNEKPQPIDVEAETADIIDFVRTRLPGVTIATRNDDGSRHCALPRDGLRVAIYSMIDHLSGVANVGSVAVEVTRQEGRVLIAFAVSGGHSSDSALTTGMASSTDWVQPVGLLVAERFARELGGRLIRSDTGNISQTFTLDIPCADV